MKKLRVPGKFSNHSLRSTLATRLYAQGLDEQCIQEITGHKSIAVRKYKKTSAQQQFEVSNLLYGNHSKKPKVETVGSKPEQSVPFTVEKAQVNVTPSEIVVKPVINIKACNLIKTGSVLKLPNITVQLCVNIEQ